MVFNGRSLIYIYIYIYIYIVQCNQTGDIHTLNGSSLKLIDKFTYLGNSALSTETDIDTRLAKAWTAISSLSVIWKSDLTDKMKRSFFQAAIVSILLYRCTTWTLTKRMEKKLASIYARMLRAILNKSWRQHPTKQQLCSHLPPITETIQIRRTRHAVTYWPRPSCQNRKCTCVNNRCIRSRNIRIITLTVWRPQEEGARRTII